MQAPSPGWGRVCRLFRLDSRLNKFETLDTLLGQRQPHLISDKDREVHADIWYPEDTARNQLLSGRRNVRERDPSPPPRINRDAQVRVVKRERPRKGETGKLMASSRAHKQANDEARQAP